MLSLDDVRSAAVRLVGVAHRTPVLTSRILDDATGGTILLKAECFQRTGSFKVRGAFNAMSRLEPDAARRGVVTMSSGNHAQAVAWCGRTLGIPVVVVMPHDAPTNKRAATEAYGAEVVAYDRYSEDREAIAQQLSVERGMTFVKPYDDWAVMAGQGTVALELVEDAGPLDDLVVCVGGGGLLAGCATAAKGLDPATRIIGAEPTAGDDHLRSLRAGRRVRLDAVPPTIADGQAAVEPGELTWQVNRELLDGVVVADDAEILAAVRFCLERLRIVVEPSGACALAAVLAGRLGPLDGRRVGVTLSGGNVDVSRLVSLFA